MTSARPAPLSPLLPLLLLFSLSALAPQCRAYLHLVSNDPLVCRVGYGQRGKLRAAGVEWIRTCKHSHFCWEATTPDMAAMKQLFDYPWVSHSLVDSLTDLCVYLRVCVCVCRTTTTTSTICESLPPSALLSPPASSSLSS